MPICRDAIPLAVQPRRPEDGARGSPAARRGDRLRRGQFTTWLFRWGQHGCRRKGRAARPRAWGAPVTRLDFCLSLMDKYQQKIERGRREGNVAPLLKLETPKRSSGRTASLFDACCGPQAGPVRPCGGDRAGASSYSFARARFSRRCARIPWRSGWGAEPRNFTDAPSGRIRVGLVALLRKAAGAALPALGGDKSINVVNLSIVGGDAIV